MKIGTFIFPLFYLLFSFSNLSGQNRQIKDFDTFYKQFNTLQFLDESIDLDIDKSITVSPGDAKKYFNITLNPDKKCYPIGVCIFNSFYCFRVQIVTYGRPIFIDEFLVTTDLDGNFIDIIMNGGYSADPLLTYRMISKITESTIITTETISYHSNRNNNIEHTRTYNLDSNGNFILESENRTNR